MGYEGTLFSYGLDYRSLKNTLNRLMSGQPGWLDAARQLNVRYIFWGQREAEMYPSSNEAVGRKEFGPEHRRYSRRSPKDPGARSTT